MHKRRTKGLRRRRQGSFRLGREGLGWVEGRRMRTRRERKKEKEKGKS